MSVVLIECEKEENTLSRTWYNPPVLPYRGKWVSFNAVNEVDMSNGAQMRGILLCHSCDVKVQSVDVKTRGDRANHSARHSLRSSLLCRNSHFTRREATSRERGVA